MLKKTAKFLINMIFMFPKKGTMAVRTLFGYKVYLDLYEFQCKKAVLGLYERAETGFLAGFVTSEDICLNVGANFGYYTYLLASRGRSVVAVEPIPFMQDLISRTIEYNKINNIKLLKSACGSQNGTIMFLENENAGLSSASYGGNVQALKEYEVDVIKADELGLERLDIVVIDVEGFELEVLKGMRNILMAHRPRLLMIELYSPYLRRFGASIDEVLSLLKSVGYAPMELVDGRLCGWTGGSVLNDNFFFVRTT
jgi:FkbM family methyltransferase